MSMSRKDYQAIAAGIRSILLEIPTTNNLTEAEKTVATATANSLQLKVSMELNAVNKRFNAKTFYDYCQP